MTSKTPVECFKPIGWIAIPLLAAAAIYFPGLDSLFLLDDQANLKDLAEIPARGIEFFLFGSSSGPGGRPLSLLSFALQHESWPTDPFSFKLVNLVLHLCNGILIFQFCRKLGQFKVIPDSHGFAALVTAVWLLHPMQLSTVLYVVQRMSIISTMFMLLGMLIYVDARFYVKQAQTRLKPALTAAAVMVCMVLAVMGKETGVLLGLFLLVIEFNLLPAGHDAAVWRKFVIPVLLLPLVLTFMYLFRDINGFLGSFQIREFTPGQRLLTELNVLIDYLKLILLPVTGAFSVFHDDYPVATGLLAPARTLFSLILLTGMCVLAFILRKRLPIVSFAVGWFLAGHLLESSFLSLELYFEHRNYLASLGPILLVSWGLASLPARLHSRRTGFLLASIWPLAVLMVTVMEINLWKNPLLQAYEWVREHPESKRAVNHLLGLELVMGNNQQAMATLEQLRLLDRDDLYPRIKYITMTNCYENKLLPAETWSDILAEGQTVKYRGTGVISELNNLVYLHAKNHCPQLEVRYLSGLVDILLSNAALNPVQAQLYGVAADLAWIRGEPDEVIRYLDQALAISPRPDRQLFKLKALMAGGHYDAASKLLAVLESELAGSPRDRLMYANELQEIEQQLQVVRGIKQ